MSSHNDLEGRQVVVTGAAGGLGPALVDTLLAAGATCHLPLRGGDQASQNVRQDARIVVAAGVDLTDEAAVRAFYASRPPLWASVHLAGGFRAAPILDTTLADLHTQLEQNLTTAFLCCREAARNMRAGGRGGRIANVSSRAAAIPAGGAIAYTVAKAGVSALTEALADELRGDRIFVNAVVPSIIDTLANRAAIPAADHARWPKPAEISAAIAWLLSPANALTSGALVPVYGEA
jgi:NAD(P)-dependent dehydrogenase (short-subunit alcohol dehydrogenase family)